MSESGLPTLRWGIIATGLISSWFVSDLVLHREDAKARHIIQAIGSSSFDKGNKFAKEHCPQISPKIYSSYAEVYADPDVDIVYIGTPHAFHVANCLDAIAAGKHVLCEKAFALNARDARKVFQAARQRGVFVMEAMWTRFYPLVDALRDVLHKQKAIGQVQRVFCDFSLDMDLAALGPESRLKNPSLGAGSLLDIGIYSLTWGIFSAEASTAENNAPKPHIVASQVLSSGIDVATAAVLTYPNGTQAIVTSSTSFKSSSEFCRIEGTNGYIVVAGPSASAPESFIVYPKGQGSSRGDMNAQSQDTANDSKNYNFNKLGRGFYWEADAVAIDIASGKTENAIMPWAETVRVLELLDEMRRQGGARFPQDEITC